MIGCCGRAPIDGKNLCDRHWGMTPAPLRDELQAATVQRNRAVWRLGEYAGSAVKRLVAKLELAATERRVRQWWNAESAT